ncbi:MAG: 50S ribosomal protein L18 [Nitrospiraceae bacterium]|nr:50S ribosomal protein L18 [Nitrospiraceae bacterium]
MAKTRKFIDLRRKREQKTDYRKRLKLIKHGTPRIVVRSTNSRMLVQLIEFKPEGDVVLFGVDSKKLEDYGWNLPFNNLPAAYLTGYLFGKIIKSKSLDKDLIVDLGLKRKIAGNKLFSLLKGIIDSGIQLKITNDVFPDEDRLYGKRISDYYNSIKGKDENETHHQYSKNKNKDELTDLPSFVKKIKSNIDQKVKL